jgi:hypothetical protein
MKLQLLADKLLEQRPTGHIAYDQYVQMCEQTQAAKANVAINAAQAEIMSQMSKSLNNISAVLEDVRSHQADALAIQQELLQEDRLQAYIEEFIYTTEKLVAECVKKESDLALSTRYFLLLGIAKTVQQQGLATPVIRGRDNKAAFEKGLKGVQKLLAQLEQTTEVKEAIAWSEAERRRRQEEAERARKEKQKRNGEIDKEIRVLSDKRAILVSQGKQAQLSLTKIVDYWKKKHDAYLGDKSSNFKLIVYGVLVVCIPVSLMVFLFVPVIVMFPECHKECRKIAKEIAELDSKINELESRKMT